MLNEWVRLAAPLLILVSALLLLAAAASDLAVRRVPNAVPVALALIGLGLRIAGGSVVGGLAAAGAVFACAAACWRRGWLGGGDVKLLGAAALLLAPRLVPSLVLAVAMAGGLLALLYLLLPAVLGPAVPGPRGGGRIQRILSIERRRIGRRGPLPYAAAIAAGTLFVLIKQ